MFNFKTITCALMGSGNSRQLLPNVQSLLDVKEELDRIMDPLMHLLANQFDYYESAHPTALYKR